MGTKEFSESLIPEMLEHCCKVLGMQGGLFAWLDDINNPEPEGQCGLSRHFVEDYLGGPVSSDPMKPSITAARGDGVAILSNVCRQSSPDRSAQYTSFLTRHGFQHEVDIILRDQQKPVGVLGLFGPKSARSESSEAMAWSLHRFMEHHISFHPRVRRRRQHRLMREQFGLTEREVEVAELVIVGAPNATIAHVLGIATSTTKTYLVKIMDKLGADSRMQVSAILNQL